MGELQQLYYLPPPPLPTPPAPPPLPSSSDDPPPAPSSSAGNETNPPPPPPPRFDPSRMIGIIRRKALIKDLAAVYHAECLSYCQELLELQRKVDEQPYSDVKIMENPRKETARPTKRMKKSRWCLYCFTIRKRTRCM